MKVWGFALGKEQDSSPTWSLSPAFEPVKRGRKRGEELPRGNAAKPSPKPSPFRFLPTPHLPFADNQRGNSPASDRPVSAFQNYVTSLAKHIKKLP